MKLSQWVLGAAVAGLWLGAAQAAPFPVTKAPLSEVQGIEKAQYIYVGAPRHRYHHRTYRRYYAGPNRRYAYRYYGPRHVYHYRGPRYTYRYARPYRYYGPRRLYTKQEVRAWNRVHGF